MANRLNDQIVLDVRGIDRILGASNVRAKQIVAHGATEVQGLARRFAPVDTGALQESIGVILGWGGGDAASRAATAHARRPEAGITPLPQLANDATHVEAIVGPQMDYAEHVEFGTSVAAAQPFMHPAVELVRPRLLAAWAKLFK